MFFSKSKLLVFYNKGISFFIIDLDVTEFRSFIREFKDFE